ncbi:MOSC domain-containing protein [Arthrobacter sp. zg-Y1171]|uniref:MOSC domain-containing protein n=1 Tax=Arthrobacter sp. zg-Y1171 TaxID=2964610 RepID=UPI00210228A5|nr:MOSC N-terminal beta barrel domain-containing protein [Arthrobacter sp. zg-Y1171]MCQ1994478.1 MOSC domain-containing protein [Arthrobacter sp. zg-Y1171]UWX81437.1 MOSC domain-containing protein [Arthrobacter sp. zg-Y1171]
MPYEETPVGSVQALYRYPVKSTAGQALRASTVTDRGLQHDRRWAVYTDDGGIASGKRTRRFRPVPGLMQWSSRIEDSETAPLLLSPEGRQYRVDDPGASRALSAAFGRELTLRPETAVRHHDETPLHLVTTSSLAALEGLAGAVDERRFRANIVIDTGSRPAFCEDGWVGAELVLGGEVILRLGEGMPRCVMIDQAQAGVPAERKALKLLGAHHSAEFGLQAHAVQTGKLRVGDVVTLRRNRTA